MFVKARDTLSIGHQGGVRRIAKGEAFDEHDDLVRAHPELFDFGTEARIETATRRPGEKRGSPRG